MALRQRFPNLAMTKEKAHPVGGNAQSSFFPLEICLLLTAVEFVAVDVAGLDAKDLLESGLDARAGIQVIAQCVADEVETQHREHGSERGK